MHLNRPRNTDAPSHTAAHHAARRCGDSWEPERTGLSWSLGLLRESLRGRRQLGSPDHEDPGDARRYVSPAGAQHAKTPQRIARAIRIAKNGKLHLPSDTLQLLAAAPRYAGFWSAHKAASWRFSRRAGPPRCCVRALYRRPCSNIAVAVFVAVTDTKPRLARVQIDIWAIRTVNSSREYGSSYARHKTRWQV